MILDMARNDLGRLCMAGSVEVPARFTAEKYRSVWQMTSTVRGTLPPGITLGQILAATFPGASITGAPKAHTMEIIRDLEREPRGIYTGALGVFLPGGDFTLNLPIRTLVHRAGRFDHGLGAGIVWDSQAESEYEETLLKGSFALRLAPDLRLFETLALTGEGAWTYLEAHLARLGASAEYWDFPWDPAAARARLAACAREAGPLPRVVRMELDQDGVLNLTSRPLPAAPPAPVRVRVSAQRTDSRDRFLFHKTNQRALYDRERESAEAQGCFEALFCNERGEVTEGAITNLFARIGGRWLTPPLSAGLLPGIWREVFREETGAEEAGLPLNWLKEAEEVVIGNSVRGALTVDEIVDDAGQIWWRRADGPGHTKGEMSL
jgi:para-aminobenzoate synthetase/4-amino-4-deoxychorismate lyase